MSLWNTLTNFGDSFVMIPVAATVLLLLLAEKNWRAARLWAALFCTGGFLVAATKILFIGFGLGIQALNFTGLSGHSTFSAAIFPVVIYLSLSDQPRRWRHGSVVLAYLFALMIGVSRVKLAAHSTPEVILGLITGMGISLGFICSHSLTHSHRSPKLNRAAGICALLLCAFLHGNRAPTQGLITRVALYISHHSTPYSREQLWGEHLQPAANAVG